MATKTKPAKKWSPPKGWEVDRQKDVLKRGTTNDHVDELTGTRTYDDGTVRTFVAESEDEFEEIAAANDADVERRARMLG